MRLPQPVRVRRLLLPDRQHARDPAGERSLHAQLHTPYLRAMRPACHIVVTIFAANDVTDEFQDSKKYKTADFPKVVSWVDLLVGLKGLLRKL